MNEDQIDAFLLSGEKHFSGQEMVILNKNDEISDKGVSLGRGKRKIKPRTLSSPKMKGKTHGSKNSTGVSFPQTAKIVVEKKKYNILNQYAVAGYGTKGGVINLVFDNDASHPSELSPEGN